MADAAQKILLQDYFRKNLANIPLEKIVGAGGLAMLSAAALLALTVPGVPLALAAATLLGSIGANVLASLLQQQYQTLLDQPDKSEVDRITALAKALAPDIQQDSKLREELGLLLNNCDAIAIAEEVLRGNQAVHGWLLLDIKSTVDRYQDAFGQLQANNAQILSAVTGMDAKVSRISDWIMLEKEQLQQQLITEREKVFQTRLDDLSNWANKGYGDSIVQKTEILIAEIENAHAETPINEELRARAYRLGVNVLLLSNLKEDLERCRGYLRKAQALSMEDSSIKCEILNALLLYRTHGLQVALALLDSIQSDEALRLRFNINLENDRLTECASFLSQVEPNRLNSLEWQRSLVMYFGATGEKANLENTINSLLTGDPPADFFEIAGSGLARLAFKHFGEFCATHSICPTFQIEIDLDEFVDQKSIDIAARYFLRASELYEANHCPRPAARTLVAVIRLYDRTLDKTGGDSHIKRLAKLDPLHPFVNIKSPDNDEPVETNGSQSLTVLINHPDIDIALMLKSQQDHLSNTETLATDLVVLKQRLADADTNDVTKVTLVVTGLHLLQLANDFEAALHWLSQVPLPTQYEHLRYLLEYGQCIDNSPDQAKISLQVALERWPDHPEVLILAVKHYRRHEDHTHEFECASRLYKILRTTQTTQILLDALITSSQFEQFIKVAENSIDLHIPEQKIHSGLAYALMQLDKPPEAISHLEWLRGNGFANSSELINLARIHQLFHEPDKAIVVLRECVSRFPEESASYIEVAQIFLDLGQHRDAFAWAMRARSQFPDNPYIGLHLISTAYATGFEAKTQVKEAFQDLIPGGRLSYAGLIRTQSFETTVEFLKTHQTHTQELEQIYYQGKIPAILFCYALGTPLFRFHTVAVQSKLPRYVAVGEQSWDNDWLNNNSPSEVVLDYSAILTLWSLYKEEWAEKIRMFFPKIWVPGKILWLTLWEQRQIAQQGQLSRFSIWKQLQKNILSLPGKFSRILRRTPQAGWDATGEFTETNFAEEFSLPYLNEYTLNKEKTLEKNFGLNILAHILRDNGEIDPDTFERLNGNSKTADITALSQESKNGDAIVASLFTLERVIDAGAFEALCRFFGQIHISEPALERLHHDVLGYELNDQLRHEIMALRQSVIDARDRGVVHLSTIDTEQRWLSKETISTTDSDEEDDSLDTLWKMAVAYFDELVGIAHFKQVPIWTDDRWTSKLYADVRKPPHIFGTADFLVWAQSQTKSKAEHYNLYSKLVEFNYHGLSFYPRYLHWLLSNSPKIGAPLLQSAITLYRTSALESWDLVLKFQSYSTEIGTHIFSTYNQGLISFLQQCYEQKTEMHTVSDIFKALDLSNFATQLLGRESGYYTSLLFGAYTSRQHLLTSETARSFLSAFNEWISQVIVGSGKTPATLEDAWYWLLQYPLSMYQAAQTDQDRVIALVFAEQMLFTAPDYIQEYILRTNLAAPLRDIVGIEATKITFFEFSRPSDSPIQISIPTLTWQRDLDLATTKFILESEVTGLATHGSASFRGNWLSLGSMFLGREIIPTEVIEQYSDAKGYRTWTFLLPSFYNEDPQVRLAIWHQALRKFEILQLNVEAWHRLKEDLLSTEEATWKSASENAISEILGKTNIASDYFREALSLGTKPTYSLLTFISPEIVRNWIGMPALNWENDTDLLDWAKSLLANSQGQIVQALSTRDKAMPLPALVYSIFPDATLWQEDACQQINSLATDELYKVMSNLSDAIGQYTSLTVKYNLLAVALLTFRQAFDNGGLNLDVSIVAKFLESIMVFIKAKQSGEPLLIEFSNLESRLPDFIYTKWVHDARYSDYSPLELAYLALVGSSYVVEFISKANNMTTDGLRQLSDHLTSSARQANLSGREQIKHPTGFFKPLWSSGIYYQLSHFIHSITTDITKPLEILEALSLQEAFLDVGLLQRLVQIRINSLTVEPTWLDGALAIDIGQSIGKLWQHMELADFANGNDDLQQKLLACIVDVSDNSWVSAFHERLVQASDERVILLDIATAFLATVTTNGWDHVLEIGLLAADGLEHIKKFPKCYSELHWHLAEQMALHSSLPEHLKKTVHSIVFDPIIDNTNEYALLAEQANVFSRLVGYSLLVEEICNWLHEIGELSQSDTRVFRQAIGPFLAFWTTYPNSVRDSLREVFLQLRQHLHLSDLWELHYLCRELS